MKPAVGLCCVLMFLALALTACVDQEMLAKGDQAYQAGDLESAYQHYEKVLKQDPDNQQARKGMARVLDKLCARALDQAHGAAGNEPYDITRLKRAVAILEANRRYDPQGKCMGPRLEEYQAALTSLNYQVSSLQEEFGLALEVGDYQAALKQLRALEAVAPEHPQLAGMRAKHAESYADYLETAIRESVQRGDHRRAELLLQQWNQLPLDQARKDALAREVEQQSAAMLRQEVEGMMAAQQYYAAYLKLKRAGSAGAMPALLAQLRSDGARYYLGTAKKYLKAGKVSRAYVESVKGMELNAGMPALFDIHRDSRDKVMAAMQKYIAVSTFGSPSQDQDLGGQFSDALISYLFRVLPFGINIVERDKIDLALREQSQGLSEAANLLNVDLIISGNVSLLKIDRVSSDSSIVTQVKVGEQQALNPAYEAYLRMSPEDRKTVKAPAQMISLPSYQNVTYKKGKVTMKGFGNVAVRIFDTHKGAITYAQEFNANYAVTDEYQDEVPQGGIPGDPLELPTDTEVREKLRNRMVQQVAAVVQKHFDKREHEFLQAANYRLGRNETDLAMDLLAQGFLYCLKSKVDPADPDYTRIRETLIALTERGSYSGDATPSGGSAR